MVSVRGEIEAKNLTWHFYFVSDRHLMVVADVKELELLVEATSNHSIPGCIVAHPSGGFLEGIEA